MSRARAAWATEPALEQLRELWPSHSLVELGTRFGVGPGAVFSVALRIGLPHKPKARWATESALDQLRELWPTHSAAVIARRLGTTPCAIIGKAHRLHLEPKASPIKRTGIVAARRHRASKETLPPLPAELAPVPAPRPVFVPPARPAAAPVVHRRVVACCWPIGDSRSPAFRYCGENAVLGRPYCAEHAGVGYRTEKWKRPESAKLQDPGGGAA